MRKKFLPLSMVLITMVLAQAGLVANAAGNDGKYTPRTKTQATVSSYMKSIRANQETGLIDPALQMKAMKAAQTANKAEEGWAFMGPDNYGAPTRAIVFDNGSNDILVGTMGGHIYRATEEKAYATMEEAYNLDNAMISCMIQVDGTTFVGTGDGRLAHWSNGLSELGYETSFVGNGIYKISADGQITNLQSTTNWAFVNELAYDGTTIFAATNEGLYKSEDLGENWTVIIDGDATAVRANAGHALAVIDEDVYNITFGSGYLNYENLNDELLPDDQAAKVVAISQSDVNYMYIAYINYTINTDDTYTYSTGNILYSDDAGLTWNYALPATGMYDIFGSEGYKDNAIEVWPNNPRKVLLGGSKKVWVLEDLTSTGVYRPLDVSESGNEVALSTSYNYVHRDIQYFLVNPNNPSQFFIGTEGGVFKCKYKNYNGETYTFSNCNRYFITEDEHTSVVRTFGIGIGGDENRVLAGSLDHGTILIEGDEDLNNITTGRAIMPHWNPNSNAATVNGYYIFAPQYAGGQAAISTVNPDVMFLSTTGDMTTPLYRTETAGEDYDASNFYNADSTYSHAITNANAFRTPFAMYENYNDWYSTTTVDYTPVDYYVLEGDSVVKVYEPRDYQSGNKGYIEKDGYEHVVAPVHHAGDWVKVKSAIGEYPFSYQLQNDIYRGDTIQVKDIITTTLVCGVEDNIYMTRNAMYFNEVSKWWRIGHIEGIPTAVAMNENGDMTIVGTVEGNIYRVSNLKAANTIERATIDSTQHLIVMDTLDNTLFTGRAITAISIKGDQVLVTLGNYDNDAYVFLSNDKGDNFTSIQSNLPKAPVYSCLIERTEGDIMVGSEFGVYMREGSNWVLVNNGLNTPVTELKQATVTNREVKNSLQYYDAQAYTVTKYEGNDTIVYNCLKATPVYELVPGVDNEGVIYAATYGNGIVKYDFYEEDGGGDHGIAENDSESTNSIQLNVYPNPVRSNGNVNIELAEQSTVSYQIYDLSGRLMSSRELGIMPQGENSIQFSTEDLASGTYILRVKAGNKLNSAKIMVF